MLTEAFRMYWDGTAGAVGLVLRAHDADVRVAVTLAAPAHHHVGDAVVVRLQHLQMNRSQTSWAELRIEFRTKGDGRKMLIGPAV